MAAPATNLDDLTREQLVALLVEVIARLSMPATTALGSLLSSEDLAKRWGVPETWIREQYRGGRLYGQRLGRYVRFSEADAAAFLASDDAKGIKAPVRLLHPRKSAIHNG
jgi:hypothetical protein